MGLFKKKKGSSYALEAGKALAASLVWQMFMGNDKHLTSCGLLACLPATIINKKLCTLCFAEIIVSFHIITSFTPKQINIPCL